MTPTVVPDTAHLADAVQSARATGRALRVRGSATWLDAGRPCDAPNVLDVGALSGVVEYEPGDFTLSARAGTSLAEIARITAAHGQWLTLDPHGASSGTIGATIATASHGPLSSAFGTPRDHVLGCEFVSGAGDIVRAGGRVVKNVAGFDLVRLVTGAWGTLGAITEVTVRLRARPEDDRTIAVTLADDGSAGAEAAWRWLRGSEYTPLAAEVLSPSLAQQLSLGDARLLVRLGGNATFVDAAAIALASLGSSAVVADSAWQSLSVAEPAGAVVFRVSTRPSRVAALWARAQAFAEGEGGYAHATLTRGVVRCVVPVAHDLATMELLRAGLRSLAADATVAGERLPAELWRDIARQRSTDSLADGVRAAFDPDRIMNPGILQTA